MRLINKIAFYRQRHSFGYAVGRNLEMEKSRGYITVIYVNDRPCAV